MAPEGNPLFVPDFAVQLLTFPQIFKFSCLVLAAPQTHTRTHTSLLLLELSPNSAQATASPVTPLPTPGPLTSVLTTQWDYDCFSALKTMFAPP